MSSEERETRTPTDPGQGSAPDVSGTGAFGRAEASATQVSAEPRADRALRGYDLLGEVGSGAFAVVWRARQRSVDREVAIKAIRRELAVQPGFIRRFAAEAHLVARIEHPHVVALLDFWREPEAAYLVMQYLRGGTLERRLDEGPLGTDATVAMLRQVGGALAAAHERSVVHRDVKPANVLFDDHGYAYLSDFGIALDAAADSDSSAALSPGTPLYAAPEQLRHQQVGPQADVFSLGIVAYECLTGALPFESSTSGPELYHRQLHEPMPDLRDQVAVPDHLADAVARATAKDPAHRSSSVEQFLAELEPPDRRVAPASFATAEVENPYRGLIAFDEADSAAFFGRERLVHELLEGLRLDGPGARSSILVGASGSGKSSVVRAGLVPALRSGALPGSQRWFVTTMSPGSAPFAALAEALDRVAVHRVEDLGRVVAQRPRGLLRALRRAVAEDQVVVLVVDQLEELFTQAPAREADEFLEALAVAVEESDSPLRLVATLRADFYDRPLMHRQFAPVLKATAVDVTPLAADELESAIVEPAAGAGVSLEPGLLGRIVADTVGEPAPLPLLQYALAELFDHRVHSTMTNDAYDAIGGIGGALTARAERLYDEASAEERAATRRIFGRLASTGGSTGDLRRRVAVADLGREEEVARVLDRFGAARLLTFDRDEVTRAPTVEVAHEALLREWPRLAGWLEEDRATLREVEHLAGFADAWDADGRSDADVLRGARLVAAAELLEHEPQRLRTVDVELAHASQAVAGREAARDAVRVRRLRRLVSGTAAALVVALVAAGIALVSRNRADDQAEIAEAAASDAELQTLVSRSAAVATEDPTLAVLLALEAHRRAPGRTTERVVLDTLSGLGPIVGTYPPIALGPDECDREGFTPGDGRFDYVSRSGRLVRHDVVAGRSEDLGELVSPCAVGVLTHDDTRRLEVDPEKGLLWFSAADESSRTQLSLGEPVRFLTAAPTGPHRAILSTGPTDRSETTMQLYDTLSAEPVGAPVEGLVSPWAVFSPDGSMVAIASGSAETPDGAGPVIVLEAVTGEELFRTRTDSRGLELAFDEEANQLLVTMNGRLATFDLSSGSIVADVALGSLGDVGRGLGVREDGLVVAVAAGRVELVDRERGIIEGAGFELRNAQLGALRSDGLLLVRNDDRSTLLLDLDGGALVERSVATDGQGTWVQYNEGLVASTDITNGEVELIDVRTGDRERLELRAPDGERVVPIVAGPVSRGGPLFTVSTDGTVATWRDGELTSRVAALSPGAALAHGGGGHGLLALGGVSPDGGWEVAVVAITDAGVTLVQRIEDLTDVATAVPSANGGAHVTFADGTLTSFGPDGAEVRSVDTGIGATTFTDRDPDTGLVAVAGDRGMFVYDPEGGQVRVLDTTVAVANVAFVRNGEQLVVGRRDGTVQLWDIESGEVLGDLHDALGNALGTPTYEPESESVWIGVTGRAIELPLEPEVWIRRACDVAGRELTEAEWDRFVPGDAERTPVCADV